jgi:multimeric flavodoxin WrbA/putative sterol carrier protein
MIKILAIQGSPRGRESNTEIILRKFLEGAISAGAQAETIYLKEKKVRHCIGCYTCWTKTPGVCAIKDDMAGLLGKVRECDIIIYATPLYIYTVSALLKAFQERLIPLLDPHFIKIGDAHRHPSRYETNRKMVLVSNCGFPEVKHFDALRRMFRHIEESGSMPLVGEILVPGGELVRQEPLKELWKDTFDALFRAGVEVVKDGRVSKEAEEIIQKPVLSPNDVAEMANLWWDSHLSGLAEGKPVTATATHDMKLVLRGMAATFNAEAAGNLKAVIQFEVTGKQAGNWFFAIENGKCIFTEGVAANPSLTIKTPSEIWLAIANKEIDGQQALMDGKYKVEGDMVLLMSLKRLFART